jgi:hypothetical protein
MAADTPSTMHTMRPEIHKDHRDPNSRWLTARYEIVIRRNADDIWEYIYDPKTWTASNPNEHMGLVFYNDRNRPETGVAFYQKESVSGVYADLRGHILYAERPGVCVWNGVARYRLFGFVPFTIPEAGVIKLEKADGGTLMSHTVYLHISNTIGGRMLFRIARRFSRQPGYIPHTYKELLFFTRELESAAVPARSGGHHGS